MPSLAMQCKLVSSTNWYMDVSELHFRQLRYKIEDGARIDNDLLRRHD